MKPFPEFTYDDALKAFQPKVSASTKEKIHRRPPSAIAATRFYEGNHWQDSEGFIGQLPPKGFPDGATIVEHIKQRFNSENVIKEVVETHRNGVLGREPLWSFLREGEPKAARNKTSNKGTQRAFEDTTGETLTPWWNERQGLKNLQTAIDIALCEGKAVIRLFFPRGLVEQDGQGEKIKASDLASALDYVYFETLQADVAGVFTDGETQRQIGIYLFRETDDAGNVIADCAELSYLNDAGDTVCRVINGKTNISREAVYRLGGRLLLHEITRSQLVTEQVQANQKGLNLAKTMMSRNVNVAGSRERTVSNAQPPRGKVRVPDPENPGKTKLSELGKYVQGAGAVMFLMGYPIYDKDGHVTGYTNPAVDVADPVPVDTFIQTRDCEERAILSQCHQLHMLIAGDATASGLSRKQAEKNYQRSLKESKTVLDAAGRWKLETSLRLAAHTVGQSERYLPLRADFNCLLDVGEPDPEDIRIAMGMREPGGPNNQPLLSDETIRQKCGVEDPAAELARIEEEAPAIPPPNPNKPPPQELNDNGDGAVA